jgi:2-dehydro-3-deoxyglucarate aldolase/4-hydroxy-2-oxoheptanedioate aldolase
MSSLQPTSTFLQRLLRGERLVGMVITLSDPAVAEIFAQAGFHWLWIDAEHSTLSLAAAQSIVQAAAASGTPCLLRVPLIDEGWTKRGLDTGVDGIIYPMVNTAEQAQRAVAMSKYPPLGQRSTGVGRAHGYGLRFKGYLAGANQRIATLVQIEHIQSVQNVAAILAVEGVDAALIGPYDLSASLGIPGQVEEAPVRQAIQRVRAACREAGKPVGIFAAGLDAARQAIQDGFDFVAAGVDCMLLSSLANDWLRQLEATPKAVQSE